MDWDHQEQANSTSNSAHAELVAAKAILVLKLGRNLPHCDTGRIDSLRAEVGAPNALLTIHRAAATALRAAIATQSDVRVHVTAAAEIAKIVPMLLRDSHIDTCFGFRHRVFTAATRLGA